MNKLVRIREMIVAGPITSAVTAIIALTMVTACATTDPSQDNAARLVAPSPAARAELRETIETALGVPVLLPADALVHGSQLIIARKPHRNLEQGLVLGTDLSGPGESFRLVRNNGRCVLIRDESEGRWRLKKAACRAEPSS